MTEGQALTVIRETLPAPLDTIRVSISPNADPAKIRQTLEGCCKGYQAVDHAASITKYMIGKLCVLIKQRKLYREWGYRSLRDFCGKEVYRPSLNKSTVAKAIRAVRTWPWATVEELGAVKDDVLVQAEKTVRKEQLSRAQAMKLLEEAGATEAGEEDATQRPRYGVIRIVVSRSFKKEFERWLGDRDAEGVLRQFMERPARKAAPHRELRTNHTGVHRVA